MKDLFVPALGNHNATLFFFSFVLENPGDYALVLHPSDAVADARIRELCAWLNIEVIEPKDLRNRKFNRVYLHPWNTEGHLGIQKQAGEVWIYADGMSGRVSTDAWRGASGFLVWSNAESGHKHRTASSFTIRISPVREMRRIWTKLYSLAGIPLPIEKVQSLEGAVLVAMRYWGASTYSTLSHHHVLGVLKEFARHTSGRPVFFKRDSRWNLPVQERQLVEAVFSGASVREYKNSTLEQVRLGHLASLDSHIFSVDWPMVDFFGFDGTLGPTFLMAQEQVRVFVPENLTLFDSTIPIHKVIVENFSWHKSLKASPRTPHLPDTLLTGGSMMAALAESRGQVPLNNTELGKRLKAILGKSSHPVSSADAKELLTIANSIEAKRFARDSKPGLFMVLKNSRVAGYLYFQAARFLPLRRAMVWVSKRIKSSF